VEGEPGVEGGELRGRAVGGAGVEGEPGVEGGELRAGGAVWDTSAPVPEPPRFEAPGAAGAHANPVVDRAAGASAGRGEAPSGGTHEGEPAQRATGEPALNPGVGMSPTGAAVGLHPPAPPYEGPERRLAQADWDRWRAEERRRAPHTYPEWRS
jgi:hypothetical protein